MKQKIDKKGNVMMTNAKSVYELKCQCPYGDYCNFQGNYDRYDCENCSIFVAVNAINKLEEYEKTGLSPDVCKNYKLFEDECISNGITFDKLLRHIDKLKSEKSCEVSSEWIPCSKRFPNKQECAKNDGEFLCFTKYGVTQVYSYSENLYKLDEYDFAYMKKEKTKNGFYDYDSEYGYMKVDIVAWIPLPAKYKENI